MSFFERIASARKSSRACQATSRVLGICSIQLCALTPPFQTTSFRMALRPAGWCSAASFVASAQSLRSFLSCTGCLPFRLIHSGEYDDMGKPRNGILSEQNSSAHSRNPGKQSIFLWGKLASPQRSEEPSIPAVRGSRPSAQTAVHFLAPGPYFQHFSQTHLPNRKVTGQERRLSRDHLSAIFDHGNIPRPSLLIHYGDPMIPGGLNRHGTTA